MRYNVNIPKVNKTIILKKLYNRIHFRSDKQRDQLYKKQ